MRLVSLSTHLIALVPHQHARLNFYDLVGERPVLPHTALRRRPELVAILRNRTKSCVQRGRNLLFVWCLHVPVFCPPSRCYGGPCGLDKVQTVETCVDRDARQARKQPPSPCSSFFPACCPSKSWDHAEVVRGQNRICQRRTNHHSPRVTPATHDDIMHRDC